jgi:mannose-6-phosphate isomerase-like protein (cupin superfamily)
MKTLAVPAFVACSAFLAWSTIAGAQTKKIDHYSAAELNQKVQILRGKVNAATGSSGQTLEKYPNHLTMLILREKDGQSELHQHTADVFIALDGSANLLTGGHMIGSKQTDNGEFRGAGLEGGTLTSLKKGDIVHIPAGVPHQLRIALGNTFTYFVVKVTEGE